MVLKSLKDRLRNSFNISVAEVDNEDKWQRSTLALAAVSSDKRYLNGQLDRAADLVENFRGVEVSRREMEFC